MSSNPATSSRASTKRSSAQLAKTRIAGASVRDGVVEQIPSRDRDSEYKRKKDAEEVHSSASDSDGSSSDEDVSSSKMKKSRVADETKTSSVMPPPVATVTINPTVKSSLQTGGGGPTWEQFNEMKRGVAHLREALAKKDQVIREKEKMVEDTNKLLEKAQEEVKLVASQHSDEVKTMIGMIHRRDIAIANIVEELMNENCRANRHQEKAEQLDRNMRKLYKKTVHRQCAFGSTCEDHAIFLIHPADGDKYKLPHYACAEHAAGLIKHSKKGCFTCPTCRYEVKQLKLECVDSSPVFIEEFQVKDDDLYAQTIENLIASQQDYSKERKEWLDRINTTRILVKDSSLPTSKELDFLHKNDLFFGGTSEDLDKEGEFYSKYPRRPIKASSEERPAGQAVIDMTGEDDGGDHDYVPTSPSYHPQSPLPYLYEQRANSN